VIATNGLAAGTIAPFAVNLAIERAEMLDIGVVRGDIGGMVDTYSCSVSLVEMDKWRDVISQSCNCRQEGNSELNPGQLTRW